jgi:hypothetical protein
MNIQELKNIINDLKIAKSFPPGKIKDQQIEDFFTRIRALNNPDILIEEKPSGGIPYREVCYKNPKENIDVTIMVAQG